MVASISDISSVATAMAAVAGLVIALFGLRTWRHQLRKNLDLELGRRTLRAALELRDGLAAFRHPLGVEDDESAVQVNQSRESRWSREHQIRRSRLQSKLSSLQAAMIEAEVAWGSDVVEAAGPTLAVVKALNLALLDFYAKKEAGTVEDAGMTREEYTEVVRIVSGLGDDKDEFHKRIVDAVKVLEHCLRPRIKI